MRIEINRYIIADSEICGGTLTFNGTRVMVWQVLEMMEAGVPIKEIIEDFPSLSTEHIKAALHYAADLTRGNKENVTVSVPLPA